MNEVSCIIVVGKPGAGKSSIGSELSKLIGGTYMSLGSFMRDKLQIPDPHIGVDKNPIYDALHAHYIDNETANTLILDCHPYPEDDLRALQNFIQRPNLKLRSVIHVDAHDEIALKRLERRPRPGQTYSERLKYYNDHAHLIERLLEHPASLRIENNIDFETPDALLEIAQNIFIHLQNQKD